MKWNGEAKKSGIEMGDLISEFKIENENRPNKNFVYPIAFLILIIAGTYNIKKSKIIELKIPISFLPNSRCYSDLIFF